MWSREDSSSAAAEYFIHFLFDKALRQPGSPTASSEPLNCFRQIVVSFPYSFPIYIIWVSPFPSFSFPFLSDYMHFLFPLFLFSHLPSMVIILVMSSFFAFTSSFTFLLPLFFFLFFSGCAFLSSHFTILFYFISLYLCLLVLFFIFILPSDPFLLVFCFIYNFTFLLSFSFVTFI